jgi:hypothetical protein
MTAAEREKSSTAVVTVAASSSPPLAALTESPSPPAGSRRVNTQPADLAVHESAAAGRARPWWTILVKDTLDPPGGQFLSSLSDRGSLFHVEHPEARNA